jgi:hypothetical protein
MTMFTDPGPSEDDARQPSMAAEMHRERMAADTD